MADPDVNVKSSSSSPAQPNPHRPPGALAQVMAENKAASTTNVRHRSPSGSAPKALLSCELCRTRKIKCDKADGGCSNCRRAGVKCIALNRQRLPRGRNGGRKKADAELKARVGRLENLVRTLEAGGGEGRGVDGAVKYLLSNEKDLESIQKGYDDQMAHAPKDMHRYLSSSFWSNLSDEVNGLRDILDDESDDDEEESTSMSSPQSSHAEAPYSFVLCGPDSLIVSPDAVQHPPRFMVQALCAEYGRNVTTVFNILHWPTLSAFLIDGKPYLDYPAGHPATEALSFAVYLTTITSKLDEDCLRDFGEPKSVLVKKYRFRLEAALSRADFINTTDLTVLQALMLLLVCARADNNNRFLWTMLALAVRIGHAMGLHEDDTLKSFTVFEHEMRRRVWNSLCVLDFQAVKDRGSGPLIPINSFSTPPPLNINDDEISPETKVYPKTRDALTSMSMNLVAGFASRVGKQLNFVPRGENGRQPTEIEQNWETRQQIVISFREEYEEHFGRFADPSNPRDVGTRVICETIARCLLLSAVRPLERHPKSNPPKISGTNLLNLTSTMLEQILIAKSNPELRPFTWFGALYNQWHSLAVMAAELCANTEGPAVDRAWSIIDPAMSHFRHSVADSEKGSLWRPIEKLLRRAREMRRRKLESLGVSGPGMLPQQVGNSNPQQMMQMQQAQFQAQAQSDFLATISATNSSGMTPLGKHDGQFTGMSPSMPNLASNNYATADDNGNGIPNDGVAIDPTFGSLMMNQWEMSPGMDLGAPSNSSESPGMAWDNWENFVQDIDAAAAAGANGGAVDPWFDVDMKLFDGDAFVAPDGEGMRA